MTENRRIQDGADDALDRALDGALARYAAVEPRAGLEGRILANLSAQTVSSNRRWWAWSVAAAMAAIVLVAMAITWRTTRTTTPVVVEQKSAPTHVSQPITTAATNHAGPPVVAIRKPLKHAQRPANPKLDVFPSPRPLNEQEKMLANYVGQFHHEAVLVARAKTEMDLRDREREMRMTAGDQDSDAASPESSTTKR